MSKDKRTAREIIVPDKILTNKNINVKVGTAVNRDNPETIYIFISFWLQPKEEHKLKEQKELKKALSNELEKIYEDRLYGELVSNQFFPKEKENIFIQNIPDNLNYNGKRNFISIELYLHTRNIINPNYVPLNAKKNTELYDEAVRLANIIGESKIIKSELMFDVWKKSN